MKYYTKVMWVDDLISKINKYLSFLGVRKMINEQAKPPLLNYLLVTRIIK